MAEAVSFHHQSKRRKQYQRKGKPSVVDLQQQLWDLRSSVAPEWKIATSGQSPTAIDSNTQVLWDLLKFVTNGPGDVNEMEGQTMHPRYLELNIRLAFPVGVGTQPVRIIIFRVKGDISDITMAGAGAGVAFFTKYLLGTGSTYGVDVTPFGSQVGTSKNKTIRVLHEGIINPDPLNYVLTNTSQPYSSIYSFKFDLSHMGATEFEEFAGGSAYAQMYDGGFYFALAIDPGTLSEGNAMQVCWASKLSFTDA